MPFMTGHTVGGSCALSAARTARPCGRSLQRAAGVLGLLLLLCVPCYSQGSNGNIKGFVTDPSGAALVGATISVQSTALMGTRDALSDEQGFYRLLDLPPGEYFLTASAPNFAKLERRNLMVQGGLTLGLDLQMKIGQVTETVEVTEQAPILEAEKVERTFNVSGEFIRKLPLSAAQNWWDPVKMLVGVLILGGEGGVMETHGSGLSSNIFTLDGIDISDVQQNYAGGTKLPIDAVSDVRITTSGHSASSPMAVGTYMTVVTRSGSNELHGTFSTDLQPKKMNWSNVPGGTSADRTIYQYSGSLGGPAIKDRLWYFGSYRHVRNTSGIARTSTEIANLKVFQSDFEPFSVRNPAHEALAKADLKLTPSDQITFTYQYNKTMTQNNANDPKWTRETALSQDSGGPLYGLTYRRFFGRRASLEVQAGYNLKPWYVNPQGEGPQVTIYNSVTQSGSGASTTMSGSGIVVRMGNVGNHNYSEQKRMNINASFGYFGLKLWGIHELKVGTNMLPINKYTMTGYTVNNGFAFEDRVLNVAGDVNSGTRPFRRQYQDPVVLPGVGKSSKAYGYYVQDTWRPGRRWVLNIGFRYDKAQTNDTWGDVIQSSWQGGPRFGVSYNLTSDRRNIIRASFNRMYDAINNLYAYSFGSLTKGTRTEYDIDKNGVFNTAGDTVILVPAVLTRPQQAGLTRQNVSTGLKQPRTDEFTLVYSRELPWKMTFDSTFILRNYKNRTMSFDTNGIYENGQFFGYRDPTYNQIYEIRNGDKNWYEYRALQLSVHKNLSHNLQFLAGYSLARMEIKGTWDENDPAGFLQPDAFPNEGGIGRTVYTASGQMTSYTTTRYYNTGTPPHNFKLSLAYEAPFGIIFGMVHTYQMGQYSGPVFTTIPSAEVPAIHKVPIVQNGRTISNPLATTTRFYYATRAEGQMRTGSINQVNLKAGKTFQISDRHLVEAAVQFYNLLNQGEQLYFNAPSIQVGKPSTQTKYGAQSPRAGQISLRWRF